MSISDVTGSTLVGVSNDLVGTGHMIVSGGAPPYTYNTVFKSGTNYNVTGNTTANPVFRRIGNPPASNVTGVFTATVTDAVSAVKSQDFNVTDNRS